MVGSVSTGSKPEASVDAINMVLSLVDLVKDPDVYAGRLRELHDRQTAAESRIAEAATAVAEADKRLVQINVHCAEAGQILASVKSQTAELHRQAEEHQHRVNTAEAEVNRQKSEWAAGENERRMRERAIVRARRSLGLAPEAPEAA